ncbi:MAG: aminotransferase class V-fold PLP-dependent enzyme [Victivallaceae bacterium]|nr:aminotransferase class V-fold PLP-dependent enzyme [Victivallaceae bacterium]
MSCDIYFDHASACTVPETVAAFAKAAMQRAFVNQEAVHRAGYESKRALESKSRELGRLLAGDGFCAAFANSGTEVFRLLFHPARFRRGNVVITALEHPALTAAARESGAELRIAGAERNGRIDLESLKRLLDRDTVLCCVHDVQSELGVRQDLAAIHALVKSNAPNAKLFCDAVQSAGKMRLPSEFFDYAAISGHKFGSPGGAALLGRGDFFLREAAEIRKTYHGGRMEPWLVEVLCFAAASALERQEENAMRVGALNACLRKALAQEPFSRYLHATIEPAMASPWILHVNFRDFDGAIIVRMLSERGICVSAGSACRSEEGGPSPAMEAIGFRGEAGYRAMRLSFSGENTLEQGECFLQALAEVADDF